MKFGFFAASANEPLLNRTVKASRHHRAKTEIGRLVVRGSFVSKEFSCCVTEGTSLLKFGVLSIWQVVPDQRFRLLRNLILVSFRTFVATKPPPLLARPREARSTSGLIVEYDSELEIPLTSGYDLHSAFGETGRLSSLPILPKAAFLAGDSPHLDSPSRRHSIHPSGASSFAFW